MKRVLDEAEDKMARDLFKRHPRLRSFLVVIRFARYLLVGIIPIAVAGAGWWFDGPSRACSLLDCGGWFDEPDAERAACTFVEPDSVRTIREKITSTMICETGALTALTVITVEGPFVDGVPISRVAVYPMYPGVGDSFFAEIVAGTSDAYDDGKRFVACIVALSEESMADVRAYWRGTDRAGITVPLDVRAKHDCRSLIHDPTAVDG